MVSIDSCRIMSPKLSGATNRNDVIKRVIKCEIVDYGNNVRLVTEVNVKRGWIFFFCDPETNYGDLEGIRTVRHSCQDLSNCDKG